LQTFAPASAPADALVGEGIAAVKAGDKAQAYHRLTQALAADPRHELGWLWLSSVVPSDAERYYCLEQVLAINPRNAAAQRGLALLPHGLLPTSPLAPAAPEPPPQLAFQPEAGPSLEASQFAALALPSLFTTPQDEPTVAVFAPAPIVEPSAGQAAPLGLRKLSSMAPQADRSPGISPGAAPARHEDTDFVIRELGANRTADEVSRMLCEQKGYPWPVAQQLVAEIQLQHRTRIARRQAPFLIVLGVMTLLGGIGLIGFAVLRFRTIGQIQSPLLYRNMLLALGLGVMMVLGSILGTAQVIRSMWK
jgi:hypothetical protein